MLIDVIILSSIAGLAAVLGAMLGCVENLKKNWLQCESRCGILAFGGGALLAAVSLVLIPKGMQSQPAWLAIGSFAIGAVCFMLVDQFFTKRGSPVSQFMAMMLDFVPEAVVLGAIITSNYREAVFLAAIIAAQNFPEGFNAYREITHKSKGVLPGKAMLLITVGALSGIAFALVGFFLCQPDGMPLGLLMTFCAGGIFYLVFREIAPQSRMENNWYPSLGAVLGFMFGMVGHAMI